MATALEVESPVPEPLCAALERGGLSWDWLGTRATGIILFGSRAAGLASSTSDWDLLCIGPRGPRPSGAVDLVWLDPYLLESTRWLGSELASHVAAYGRVLRGSHPWLSSVSIAPDAVSCKVRRILGKLEGLEVAWPVLGVSQRVEQARWLRLELQRLECLERRRPVPPTAVLDQEWTAAGEHEAWSLRMARRFEVEPARLVTMLA